MSIFKNLFTGQQDIIQSNSFTGRIFSGNNYNANEYKSAFSDISYQCLKLRADAFSSLSFLLKFSSIA
jgi:hypothetical protein